MNKIYKEGIGAYGSHVVKGENLHNFCTSVRTDTKSVNIFFYPLTT